MSIDPNQHFEPVAETGVKAYAIFADWSGLAPNSEAVMLFSSKELADAALPMIESGHNYLAVIDDLEHAKSWVIGETIAYRRHVKCSLNEAFSGLEPQDTEDYLQRLDG